MPRRAGRALRARAGIVRRVPFADTFNGGDGDEVFYPQTATQSAFLSDDRRQARIPSVPTRKVPAYGPFLAGTTPTTWRQGATRGMLGGARLGRSS